MINQVIIEGRLTKQPELRTTQNGKHYCQFTLASQKNKDITNFVNCVIWEAGADNFTKYLSKGQLTSVEGEVVSRSYDGADGQKRYVTEINVSRFHFLESKKEQAPAPTTTDMSGYTMNVTADELPF